MCTSAQIRTEKLYIYMYVFFFSFMCNSTLGAEGQQHDRFREL